MGNADFPLTLRQFVEIALLEAEINLRYAKIVNVVAESKRDERTSMREIQDLDEIQAACDRTRELLDGFEEPEVLYKKLEAMRRSHNMEGFRFVRDQGREILEALLIAEEQGHPHFPKPSDS